MSDENRNTEKAQNQNLGLDDIHWMDWPALSIFSVLMVIVFTQFFTRYVLNDSWAWTEEVARFLLVALVFSGSLSVVYRGEHIFLEVVHRLVPRENTKPLAIFSEALGAFYYIALGVMAVMLMAGTDQNLISIAVPKAWIYGFVAVTLICSGVFSTLRLLALYGKTSQQIYADMDAKIVEDSVKGE